jgi:hypothetical protein
MVFVYIIGVVVSHLALDIFIIYGPYGLIYNKFEEEFNKVIPLSPRLSI